MFWLDKMGAGMTAEDLLNHAIKAHDPTGIWDRIDKLNIKLRICGKILMTKFKCPTVRELDIEVATDRPWIRINNFPDSESYGILDAYTVSLYSQGKEEKRTIEYPYKFKLFWDRFDLLFFFGYALWNYVNSPFIFKLPGFKMERLADLQGEYRLQVTFPQEIPSHCRTQVFYFNEEFLQTRLDYTAEVFWGSARGRHYCEDFKTIKNITVATHRYVYPFNLNFFKVMEGWVEDLSYSFKDGGATPK